MSCQTGKTSIRAFGDCLIAFHPEHQPLVINPDGTTDRLRPEKKTIGD